MGLRVFAEHVLMEWKSHVITVTTLTRVSCLYPETNEHEHILDADLNNTIVFCSAFHAVPWFLYSSAQ